MTIMIMQDQSKRLSEPLRWGRRERTVVAVVLACVAARRRRVSAPMR